MRLGDVLEGQKVILLDREYEVVRQGTSGTTVRLTARIAKEVKNRDGTTAARFSSKAKPTLISSACEVSIVA